MFIGELAMDGHNSLELSHNEISRAFSHEYWARRFPPLMSVDQAAALLQVPIGTVYQWRSRGLLNGCSTRVGRYVRFFRDRLVHKVMNEGVSP